MSTFHIGVVEDRQDPKQMGRLRVRVLGIHSDDRVNDVPINMLPWSMVVHPANASSTSGGISQLVEGTWVLVMYLDETMQDPIVVGSLPSTVGPQKPDYTKGFSDPFGVNPKWSDGQSDTSLIGKEDKWQEHPTYTERSRSKVGEIPMAKTYATATVSTDPEEPKHATWKEPELRGGGPSKYPYNAVKEYEGGMVEEFDSTPGATRMTRLHPSGTYDEVIVDGTKTTKIVGDGYEITLGNHMMYVKGNLNVTVEGDMRQFVKGDYILEVGGSMRTLINTTRQTKVSGNDVLEVSNDQSINIKNNHSLQAGNNGTVRFGNNHSLTIGNDETVEVSNNLNHFTGGNSTYTTSGRNAVAVTGDRMVITMGSHKMESFGSITLDTSLNLNVIALVEENHRVGGIFKVTTGGLIILN
jgi:hypothetical protein